MAGRSSSSMAGRRSNSMVVPQVAQDTIPLKVSLFQVLSHGLFILPNFTGPPPGNQGVSIRQDFMVSKLSHSVVSPGILS
jgi:hypothetical protein